MNTRLLTSTMLCVMILAALSGPVLRRTDPTQMHSPLATLAALAALDTVAILDESEMAQVQGRGWGDKLKGWGAKLKEFWPYFYRASFNVLTGPPGWISAGFELGEAAWNWLRGK